MNPNLRIKLTWLVVIDFGLHARKLPLYPGLQNMIGINGIKSHCTQSSNDEVHSPQIATVLNQLLP